MSFEIENGVLKEYFSENDETAVVIPDSVTSIEKYAFGDFFSGGSSLESVTIPKSVTSIGYEAFSDCENLKFITLPNSVTNIEKNAFTGCKKLETLTFKGTKLNYKKILESSASINEILSALE